MRPSESPKLYNTPRVQVRTGLSGHVYVFTYLCVHECAHTYTCIPKQGSRVAPSGEAEELAAMLPETSCVGWAGLWGPMFWGVCLSVLCPPADRIGSPAPDSLWAQKLQTWGHQQLPRDKC